MNWCKKELALKGEPEFLKNLECIIDRHNPVTDSWRYTGLMTDILNDLHINSKPYADLRNYWTKAVFNRYGHLVITERTASDDDTIYAEVIRKAYPDKVFSINRISITYC